MNLNPRHALHSLKMSALFGGILGLGFGCVISLEPIEPCETGSNNKLDDNGECECRIGYEWCDPNDGNNLNCCDEDANDGETGDGDGDPSGDGDDETGDGDGDSGDGDGDSGDGDGDSGDGDGDSGDGDGDGDCAPGELPPSNCSSEEEGFYWCTHSEQMGPECSQFFICQGGVWVENAGFMDESCGFDGYDFAYGCVDDGSDVIFECGDGPGSACDNEDPLFCVDDDQIGYCQWGKETHDSCLAFCQEEGIDGQTYEYGECDDSISDDIACFCCDAGDDGCPI